MTGPAKATAQDVQRGLRRLADDTIAQHSQGFFKTGKGEYGEGDRFLGIRVPVIRKQARQFSAMPLNEAGQLLRSPWHEERLCALFILVEKYRKADAPARKSIFRLYKSNLKHINNWDLVDSSAHQIVGAYLEDKDRALLYEFAQSNNLWKRRIAMVATCHYIKKGDLRDALRIAEILLPDREDLIHKAAGWMLREVGKQDTAALKAFLRKHCRAMPRTMLRYAIERFPEPERKKYLAGTPSHKGATAP